MGNYIKTRCTKCANEAERFRSAKFCLLCGGRLEVIGGTPSAYDNSVGGEFAAESGRAGQRKKPEQREHAEQVALFQWVGANQAHLPELRLLHAIPNGGARAVSTGQHLKAEGVRAGVLDLNLPLRGWGQDPDDHNRRREFIGLWIEMKAKGGSVTKTGKDGSWGQEDWIRELRKVGQRVEVCWSSVEAIRVLEDYLGVPAEERALLF